MYFSEFAKKIEYGPHGVVHSILGGDQQLGQMANWRSPQGKTA